MSGGGKRWDGNVGGGGEVVVRMRLPNWGMDWICRVGTSEALRVRAARLGVLERQEREIAMKWLRGLVRVGYGGVLEGAGRGQGMGVWRGMSRGAREMCRRRALASSPAISIDVLRRQHVAMMLSGCADMSRVVARCEILEAVAGDAEGSDMWGRKRQERTTTC